ncbi:histidine kinase [Ciceribacter sp. L1K23]|uniref:ATP-binding protein n=1 Tax=unclassified Ciceribacter TaxID=2628820 RepID=UPI001ABDC9C1|nr:MULTISPECIES: ATP-binding protein [unclassified Ciceribacter]MBO3759502.1 histidine kinase [Ciceribacter sp. L1K22]MBR0556342.1 histidine kinase [Ciceribacter sp. L1K23]
MRVRSLTERVLLLATLWSAVALISIAVVISALYRQGAERSFNNLLHAHLFNVINAISIGADGNLSGNAELGNLRFSQPASGWYWLVEPLGSFASVRLTSTSLGVNSLTVPSVVEAPFDENYERYYEIEDYAGNRLRVVETEVVLDGENHAARFRVAGNLTDVEEDIAAFQSRLYIALAIFGLGGLLLNAFAILYGLRPLVGAKRALEKIRAGEAAGLEGDFPREIMPLVNEVNALIESNRRIVERARMQVGNLAHSLKTPIAVLLNESRALPGQKADVVRSQAEAMQAQVTSYLNRARIAAQRESVLARCELDPVAERLTRVMRKLNPGIAFDFRPEHPGLALAMEQQDLEEILGNLLENAGRYARERVLVTARPMPDEEPSADAVRRLWIEVLVEDDGPGLEPDQITEALKRGRRLDESKPGTGLGLSIVKEISSEYQGTFSLSRASQGGLQARLKLPAVTRESA